MIKLSEVRASAKEVNPLQRQSPDVRRGHTEVSRGHSRLLSGAEGPNVRTDAHRGVCGAGVSEQKNGTTYVTDDRAAPESRRYKELGQSTQQDGTEHQIETTFR